MTARIYLDNNATTGLDPRVLEAMLPELSLVPSNPSSTHSFGQEARKRLLKARETLASFFRVKPHEVIFTSGGTEAMNLLIHGILEPPFTGHVITSDVEHSCVDKALKAYAQKGVPITFVPVGLWGAVRPEAIEEAIRSDTRAIILSAVNNETGVKIDLNAIAEIADRAKIPLIIDGVCLVGKELFDLPPAVLGLGASAHKFHGPKGVGFAIVRSSLKLSPLFVGGDQEYQKRAGTENLPGIVGLAKAIELLNEEMPQASLRMRTLRENFEKQLMQRLDPVIINGAGPRICNTSNLAFRDVQGEDLLMLLDLNGVAASHGSACSSGALEPSRVLTQMGIPHSLAKASIRFSLSRFTTQEEMERCTEILVKIVTKLRNL
ncbi:MAG: cysteine desulfurase [Rhabdochlamydiaceae bacterium]|nr:cysteine desulfurase [Rhabdochlamydiaceae bacterium]